MIDKSKNEKDFPIEIRNNNGNLIRVENFKGSYISFDYDDSNRLVRVERSDGFWCTFKYNEISQIIAFENSNKIWKKFQYNKFGDIKNYEDSFGSNVIFLYDDDSCLKCEVGKVVVYINSSQFHYPKEFRYDEEHREAFTDLWDVFEGVKGFDLLQHSDELRYIEFYYNKKGQRIKSVREDGSIEKYEYNAYGNLITILGPDGTEENFNFKYTIDGKFSEYSDKYKKIEVEYFNNICIRKKYENKFTEEFEEQKYRVDGLPLSHTVRLLNGKHLQIESNHYEIINKKIRHTGKETAFESGEKIHNYYFGYSHDEKGRLIGSTYTSPNEGYRDLDVQYDDENKIANIHKCIGIGPYADTYLEASFEQIPEYINPKLPSDFERNIGSIVWESTYWKNLVIENENKFEFDYIPIGGNLVLSEPKIKTTLKT